MLQLTNVQVDIGLHTILKDITFTINKGEILALLGHNGAGKSTTMKAIMGWQEKKEGTITINQWNQDNEFLAFKKEIAYIPEEPFLLSELTVMQHFQLYGQSYEIPEDIWMKRVEKYTRLFEIEDKLDEYPESLSKGMRQKVQTICALLPDCALLLIDEPFMGLDVHAAMELEKLIKLKADRGTSVLLTSHQLDRVKKIASKYVMLQNGVVLEERDMRDFDDLKRRREDGE
ncbi:ABC transporter ATP-binding protein [Gracilibacillus marinus]|jgi:ABC-2 type transport system ATP-binding protein|uniref:ABC transporter ATP-binding protein n=1 Tax=Gracilibacillus marinus TaxID=630535 RepID=A0ABV8VX23_9BACI